MKHGHGFIDNMLSATWQGADAGAAASGAATGVGGGSAAGPSTLSSMGGGDSRSVRTDC